MKRRAFLTNTIGGTLGGLAVATSETALAAGNEMISTLVTSPAVVMAPRADGATLVWAVSRLSRGRVEWKSKQGKGQPYVFWFGKGRECESLYLACQALFHHVLTT
jgi:LDH2 family malate/lactate/ureidoglycolate dehydrogenase